MRFLRQLSSPHRSYRIDFAKDRAIQAAMERISSGLTHSLPLHILHGSPGSLLPPSTSPGAITAPVTDRGRRARRSVDGSGGSAAFPPGRSGDYAATEYEQELIIKEILRVEAFEKRIEAGKVDRDRIPRQIGEVERRVSGR